MSTSPRRPAAFRLDDPRVSATIDTTLEELEPEAEEAHEAIKAIVRPRRRAPRWGRVAAWSGGLLVSIALALALDGLVRELFERAGWLGWAGAALVGLFVLAVLALLGREVAGLMRLKRLARLRLQADDAAEANDSAEARTVARALVALYAGRPETAQGRRRLAEHAGEIMDGRDLLTLAERDLIAPLDARARAMISASARRVSLVTAVSPRAIVDLLFVLWEALRLVRGIAALYCGRPGTVGLARLSRAVVAHLAVTGTMAAGDSVIQQVVGHGLAARLSARLGEGIVNGLMTARIGLAAMDVCRPLPFLASPRPRLKDLTGDLVTPAKAGEAGAA
jgi:putative membrane protein